MTSSASPLPRCSGNAKRFGGHVPPARAVQPLPQMTKPDCQVPWGCEFLQMPEFQGRPPDVATFVLCTREWQKHILDAPPWRVQFPCQLSLLFHIWPVSAAPHKGKHAGRQKISPSADPSRLRGHERGKQIKRAVMQPARGRSDPQGPSNWGY